MRAVGKEAAAVTAEIADLGDWQGGSKAERLATDTALHDCVMERTNDKILAEAMFLGVRTGWNPAFTA